MSDTAAINSRPRRAYFDGPYGQVHVQSLGEGGLPLLLLHQSPLSGSMFDAVLALLAAKGFHAVAMDTPGYGQSDRPTTPVGIAGYADAIPAVLGGLGWQSANILGHHTGGLIAASFAARHPALVKKLIINGAALFSKEDLAHFAQFDFQAMDLKADGSHLIAAWEQRLKASPGWSNLAAMHRYVADSLTNPNHAHWGFEAAFTYDFESDLKQIGCPAMILTNTGEDLYQQSRNTAVLRPDFTYGELQGGTHDIVDEQPQNWTDMVTKYLLE